MLNYSSDPIFVTERNESFFRYSPLRSVVPIICDTKYIICLDGVHDCSQPGGVNTVSGWLTGRPGEIWDEIRNFVTMSLSMPPIATPSFGTTAIAASQTVIHGLFQYDTEHATARRELARMVYTGMLMLASVVPLSALGHWDVGFGSVGLHRSNPQSLCRNVIMQSPAVATVPALPYVTILAMTLLIVLISYGTSCVRGKSTRMSNLRSVWVLYTPGQLHREVAERIRGEFAAVDTSTSWPTVRKRRLGPDIVTRHQQKYFGIGVSVNLSFFFSFSVGTGFS